MSKKKRIGDRWDGALLRNTDAMHFIMPLIFPNRCDNEAFVSERVDLTRLSEYLDKKNSMGAEYKYNLFQAIVTAILKTVTLRPKMNRFIKNNNLYQRNGISASFIVKKQFTDSGEEGLAFIHSKETDTIDDIHNEIYRQVSDCRKGENKDTTSEVMEIFNKLPRGLSKAVVKLLCFLESRGRIPASFVEADPYYSSVILTNLGSIKLHSGYHHLTNWGTTSVFVIVGERKMRPFFDENGNVTMRDSVDLGFTVDERIADGYYFSETIKLFKNLLENPELLDAPMSEEVLRQ